MATEGGEQPDAGAEIKMERVMELLLSEADNKRFAYLHDTCADNPVVNAYCDLVTALARKDVQLIYPQIVEGGTRIRFLTLHARTHCVLCLF
jgi:hypothetical protein